LYWLPRDKKTLDAARDKLSDTGRKVRIYSFDMSNTDKISELYAEIANDTGGIDILVNNAGGTRRGPADMLTSLRATYYTSTADFSAPSAPVPGSI
jgi:short-subunit dehydrogenase